MPVRLYGHLSWVTFARLPRIDERVAEFLSRFLPAECMRHGAQPLALGLVRDHVHMVIKLPSRFDAPRLVQGLKGASARLANRDGLMPRAPLRWAEGYDLRSVGVRQLGTVLAYVENQAARHPELTVDQCP